MLRRGEVRPVLQAHGRGSGVRGGRTILENYWTILQISPESIQSPPRPLITREIVYRLLRGDQGNRLRHLALLGGHTDRIAEAVERLRRELNQPLRIDSLARELGMSVSGFHHHFKAVTAMSPLQFQKQLRLREARRILFSESLDAASAGHRVGYDDASQFSREYKRLFGQPPCGTWSGCARQ